MEFSESHTYVCSLSENNYQKYGSKNKMNMFLKILIAGLTILILAGMLILYFQICSSYDNDLNQQLDYTLYEMTYNSQNSLNKLQNYSGTSSIKTLIIKDMLQVEITYQQFPNLKKIVLFGGKSLIIDSRVGIETLVINDSKIVDFSYSSTQVKTIILVNNPNMISFQKSILPALTNLTIINTNIKVWQKNQFGNINFVGIYNVQNSIFPIIQAKEINLIMFQNCTFSLNYQGSLNILRKITFNNCQIKRFFIKDNSFIEQINFIMGQVDLLKCNNCSALKEITILNVSKTYSLIIEYCWMLENIIIDYAKIYNLILIDTNVSKLQNVDALNLLSMEIKQTPFLEISTKTMPNAPILDHLLVDYSKVKSINPFNIVYPSLKILMIFSFNSTEILNLTKLILLQGLYLTNTMCSNFIVKQNLKMLSLNNVFIHSQPKDYLQIRSLNDLNINNTNIEQVNNLQLPYLRQITFNNNTLLKRIFNLSFENLLSISILNQQKQLQIYNNTFKTENVKIINVPKLIWNQTYYPVKENLTLSINTQRTQELNFILPLYFEQLTSLILGNYLYKVFYKMNFTAINNKLQTLQIRCDSCGMQNSSILNIRILKLVRFTEITENSIPNLNELYLKGCISLDKQMLLKQIEKFKADNVDLKYLSLPVGTTKDYQNSIKAIYPDIIIS